MNKTNIIILIIFLTGIWFTLNSFSKEVIITSFDECVAAGNPVMESYPRRCADKSGNSFTENIDINDVVDKESLIFNCEEDQRNVDACIEIYQPVCATVNVQCITEPCDPIKETYPNSCFACQNSLVESYAKGECEE